jgi:hypothetical protein
MLETPQDIAAKVRAYCEANGVAVSQFGMQTAGDPNLIFDMEKGRNIRLALAQKIYTALETEAA